MWLSLNQLASKDTQHVRRTFTNPSISLPSLVPSEPRVFWPPGMYIAWAYCLHVLVLARAQFTLLLAFSPLLRISDSKPHRFSYPFCLLQGQVVLKKREDGRKDLTLRPTSIFSDYWALLGGRKRLVHSAGDQLSGKRAKLSFYLDSLTFLWSLWSHQWFPTSACFLTSFLSLVSGFWNCPEMAFSLLV